MFPVKRSFLGNCAEAPAGTETSARTEQLFLRHVAQLPGWTAWAIYRYLALAP